MRTNTEEVLENIIKLKISCEIDQGKKKTAKKKKKSKE
jgi:hypothetical protein